MATTIKIPVVFSLYVAPFSRINVRMPEKKQVKDCSSSSCISRAPNGPTTRGIYAASSAHVLHCLQSIRHDRDNSRTSCRAGYPVPVSDQIQDKLFQRNCSRDASEVPTANVISTGPDVEPSQLHKARSKLRRMCLVSGVSCLIAVAACCLWQDPAQAFNIFGGGAEEKDPVEPFTLYVSVEKKYLIENIVDEHVVSRKKGFTASVCVNAVDASQHTPELASLPAGMMVSALSDPCCAKGEAQSREGSCQRPCETACNAAIARHLAQVQSISGYYLDSKDRQKVLNQCINQCFSECTKPGKKISFVLPFRF